MLRDNFGRVWGRCRNCRQICTDGSEEDSKVGCAFVSDSHGGVQRLPDDSSVFAAEAGAVDLALDFVGTCDANNGFIVFSGSLSVSKAVNRGGSGNPRIRGLLEECQGLLACKEVALCWILGHVGVRGSEMVDRRARASLSLEPDSFGILFFNFGPSINRCILEEWQASWSGSVGDELLDIRPAIGGCRSVVRGIGGEEVVLS